MHIKKHHFSMSELNSTYEVLFRKRVQKQLKMWCFFFSLEDTVC